MGQDNLELVTQALQHPAGVLYSKMDTKRVQVESLPLRLQVHVRGWAGDCQINMTSATSSVRQMDVVDVNQTGSVCFVAHSFAGPVLNQTSGPPKVECKGLFLFCDALTSYISLCCDH
jgi:hypothetical protein